MIRPLQPSVRRVASDRGHLASKNLEAIKLGYEGFPVSQRQAATASGKKNYRGPEGNYQK